MSSATKEVDGKTTSLDEEWVKQYRLALKKYNQKNYVHAETLFKDGSLKYKGAGEAVIFRCRTRPKSIRKPKTSKSCAK